MDVVDGIAKVADHLCCPMTGTIFSKGNPAAFVQSDGTHYGKEVYRADGTSKWELIEAAQPVRTDLHPLVSVRACNRSITSTDAEGSDSVQPNSYLRFFKHPISAQYIRVDPFTLRVFQAPTDAGEALVGLINVVKGGAPVNVAGIRSLTDMIAEPVQLKIDGNNLNTWTDVRRALPPNVAAPSMQLVDEWKKSFTTPITVPNYLPKGYWDNALGRTELESIDAFMYRAHNRDLAELTKNCVEDPHAPNAPMRPPNNNSSGGDEGSSSQQSVVPATQILLDD